MDYWKRFSLFSVFLIILLTSSISYGQSKSRSKSPSSPAKSTTSNFISGKSIPNERQSRYKSLLLDYFSTPRHPLVNEESWLRTRQGVITEFEKMLHDVPNATLEIQDFITQVLYQPNFPSQVSGKNIIVTFRGENWQTGKDQIVLIGAHYDSDGHSPLSSVDDNGSGVVAMLEVARGLADAIVSRRAKLINTVIFVAFDIQRFEHELVGELDHGSGSTFYVREKLATLLKIEPRPMFTGAIILDAVMNFNGTEKSQVLPTGYEVTFPEANEKIKNSNFVGNYLNMVTKERLRSLQLDAAFSQAWTKTSSRFPLITLEIRRDVPSPALFEFLRQDHIPFWNYAIGSQEAPLPAILVTDTGKWRGIQRVCGGDDGSAGPEILCQPSSLLTQERMDMLDHVVLTLDQFVSDSQLEGTIDAQPNNSAISDLCNLSAIILTLFISFFLL